jgi:hypothetical protein
MNTRQYKHKERRLIEDKGKVTLEYDWEDKEWLE